MMSIEVAQTLVIIIEANNLFLNYYFLEWEGRWYFILQLTAKQRISCNRG
jgi:hypothetical protein